MPALVGLPAAAQTQIAQVSVEVPQGKVKTVRLRRLPDGTTLAIVVTASGRLGLALLAASQLKSPHPRALFAGAFDRKLSFKVKIPETSDYYLMLDNRRGKEEVSATVAISAQRQRSRPKPAPDKKNNEERAALPASRT